MTDHTSNNRDYNSEAPSKSGINFEQPQIPQGFQPRYPQNYIPNTILTSATSSFKAPNASCGDVYPSQAFNMAQKGADEPAKNNAQNNTQISPEASSSEAYQNISSSHHLQKEANSATNPQVERLLGLVAAICSDEKLKQNFLNVFSADKGNTPDSIAVKAILSTLLANKHKHSQDSPKTQTPRDLSARPTAEPISQQYHTNATQNTLEALPVEPQSTPANSALEFAFAEFEQATPGYFSGNSVRARLKDYLVQNSNHLEKNEISDILNMAKSLESQAIEGFKKELAKNNDLNTANRQAMLRLSTNSSGANRSEPLGAHVFSRDEISKMSVTEFKKHQDEIFEQYRQNLIK